MTINNDEKQAIKEGIKEWLDEQILLVGRWGIRFFFILLFVILIRLYLAGNINVRF